MINNKKNDVRDLKSGSKQSDLKIQQKGRYQIPDVSDSEFDDLVQSDMEDKAHSKKGLGVVNNVGLAEEDDLDYRAYGNAEKESVSRSPETANTTVPTDTSTTEVAGEDSDTHLGATESKASDVKRIRVASSFILFLSLSFLGSVSGFANLSVDSDTERAVKEIGASAITELKFSEGSFALSDEMRREISGVMDEARKKGAIDEVRVAAWSDQEYPAKDAKLSKEQRKLAKKRAESLESYIEKNLNFKNVKPISMAERPDVIQRLLRTKTEQTKTAMENAGIPTTETGTGFLGLKGKASHAIILVYYK